MRGLGTHSETGDVPQTEWTGPQGLTAQTEDIDRWFVSEIVPLEPMVLRFLARNWRRRDEIEDLLQEIYVRVYEAAAHERPHAAKPFLFAVARHLMIDRIRHNQVVPIETVTDFDDMSVADDEPSPERHLVAREELRRVQDALAALPQRCRQILLWRRLDQLPQRAVAERLGVTEAVVEYQLAKAIRLMSAAVREPLAPARREGRAVRGREGR